MLSIDALRGLDMFFITGLGATLQTFGLWTETEWGVQLARQMSHIKGPGLHLLDCVFPVFLFLAGVSWPFSCAAAEARGMTRLQIVRKILVRVFMLALLGYLHVRILSFDWKHLYSWPVIMRIGLAWGFAALMYLFVSLRGRIVLSVAILAGYWAVMRYVPAPGAPEGVNPLIDRAWSIAWWIDTNYLTLLHRPEGGFAVIPMLSHAMIGTFVGSFMRRTDITDARRTLLMFAGTAGLFAAGFALLPICPCVKGDWSPSFAFITCGIGLAFLTAFHWLIDVKGWKRWAFPFIVVGMNSITIYMLVVIVDFRDVSRFFLGGLASLGSPGFSKMLISLGSTVAVWLVMWFLYCKKVFLKV